MCPAALAGLAALLEPSPEHGHVPPSALQAATNPQDRSGGRPAAFMLKSNLIQMLPDEFQAKVVRAEAEQLLSTFDNCGGAYKVILNPTREGSWFPFTEVSSGRALPPASRSAQGVGYFRMGDDMSRNGGAFLSTDGGETYVAPGEHSSPQQFDPAASSAK